jgi:hypothetical protein
MKRIDTDTAAANLHGAGKSGWRDGVGAATLASTRGNASYANHVQEELAGIVEGSGFALDSNSYNQAFEAIRKLVRTLPVIASMQYRAGDSSHDLDGMLDVCFAPTGGPTADGIFVAVGFQLTTVTPGGRLWSSYDGYSWAQTSTGLAVYHRAVAFGNDLFVVVGNDYTLDAVIAVGDAATAALTGVDISALTANNVLRGVCHDATNNRFIAVGDYSSPNRSILYSNSIGTVWLAATPANSYTGGFIRVMTAVSGRVFATGTLGVIQTTDNGGTTWTERFNDSSLGALRTIAEVDGVILVSTEQRLTILRSADNGVTWTEVGPDDAPLEPQLVDPAPEMVGSFQGVAFAVMKDDASERRRIVISLDRGLTWPYVVRTPSNGAPAPEFQYAATANDESRLVMVGSTFSGTTAVALGSAVSAVADL